MAMHAPEEIVLALFGGRHAERHHLHAARIERAHHLLDRAVLAGRVPALQHDQHRVQLRAPHHVLQVEELVAQAVKALLRLLARHVIGRLGRDVVEPHFHTSLAEDVARHDYLPLFWASLRMRSQT